MPLVWCAFRVFWGVTVSISLVGLQESSILWSDTESAAQTVAPPFFPYLFEFPTSPYEAIFDILQPIASHQHIAVPTQTRWFIHGNYILTLYRHSAKSVRMLTGGTQNHVQTYCIHNRTRVRTTLQRSPASIILFGPACSDIAQETAG